MATTDLERLTELELAIELELTPEEGLPSPSSPVVAQRGLLAQEAAARATTYWSPTSNMPLKEKIRPGAAFCPHMTKCNAVDGKRPVFGEPTGNSPLWSVHRGVATAQHSAALPVKAR